MSAHVSTDSVVRIVCSFRLEEVGKVNREPVVFPRIKRTGIAIDRKLYSCFDSNCPVHSEHAGTEEHLFCSAARNFKILPLQRAGSFAGEFSENAPIPAGVIGAPSKWAVTVDGGVGKQVRAAVAFRFRVKLVTRAHPGVLTPRCNTCNPADEVAPDELPRCLDVNTTGAYANVVQSNLTVIVESIFSFDCAGICVQPPT